VVISKILTTDDKQTISCRHYKNNHPHVVVIAHGFYNSKDADLLQGLAGDLTGDYDVFMFDFRGHGKSSGQFSWTSKEHNDLAAVLEYLQARYEKIAIIAFSLGASIGINLLSRSRFKKVGSLILVSCPSEFEKIDYKFWQLDLKGDLIYTLFAAAGRRGRGVRPGAFWLKKEKPIENVRRVGIPILYIHGERDWVVKPWHSRALYEKTQSKKKLLIIKRGPHAEYLLRDCPEDFVRAIRKWLFSTMRKSDEPKK
jgi:pimeloyl-ACP methyl ester carboxylesterase